MSRFASPLRRVILSPYRKGKGPRFVLETGDPVYRGGRDYLGYRLSMRENGTTVVMFEGDDFGCSPCDGIDSDASLRALLGFLTLRPGDTDDDYFADYTPAQLDYCDQHAEALSAEADRRFGEE